MTFHNRKPDYGAESKLIRRLMEEQGITASSLATSTGITEASMSRKLSGKTAFSIKELDAVARALGSTASIIIGAAENGLYLTTNGGDAA